MTNYNTEGLEEGDRVVVVPEYNSGSAYMWAGRTGTVSTVREGAIAVDVDFESVIPPNQHYSGQARCSHMFYSKITKRVT